MAFETEVAIQHHQSYMQSTSQTFSSHSYSGLIPDGVDEVEERSEDEKNEIDNNNNKRPFIRNQSSHSSSFSSSSPLWNKLQSIITQSQIQMQSQSTSSRSILPSNESMDSLYQASFTPEQGGIQEVIRDEMKRKKEKGELYLAEDHSPCFRILVKTNEWFFQEEMVSSLIHEV